MHKEHRVLGKIPCHQNSEDQFLQPFSVAEASQLFVAAFDTDEDEDEDVLQELS